MARSTHILGMNARNQTYGSLNKSRSRRRANSKLATKRILSSANVSVPALYGVINSREKLHLFKFKKVETSFVVKPSGGAGGQGILLVRRPKNFQGEWLGVDGKKLTEDDIKLHIGDILEGQYSTFGTSHRAFIEERVPIHPKLKKYVYKGTPDIRVIVFNSVPVMAMLRLPTKKSDGKANLHQGGIGVGIDIGSGVTMQGIHNSKQIKYLPDTKIKLNGIKIPNWKQVLRTAVEASIVMEMKFVGVDILLHPEKDPMVIELNARPGLAIQVANDKGLRFRLERVEGIEIRDVVHGVKVGQALFAERFADKVKANDGVIVVGTEEVASIIDDNKKYIEVNSMIDTGSYRSTIDRDLATKLGLITEERLLWKNKKSSAIELIYYLKGRKIKSAVSVVNRSRKKIKMSIGRHDLQGFLINPQKEN